MQKANNDMQSISLTIIHKAIGSFMALLHSVYFSIKISLSFQDLFCHLKWMQSLALPKLYVKP
jgi:hypothetical protein